MPSFETASPDHARKPLPDYILKFQSANGSSVAGISPYGGQVWLWEVHGHDILFPLEDAHSISRDPRPRPNPEKVGETSNPGGTWLSCGGGIVRDQEGSIVSEAPVHGPFSSPSNRQRLRLGGNRAVLDGGVVGMEPFFLPGQRVELRRREVMATDGVEGSSGALIIMNTLVNLSAGTMVLPTAVEHAYLVSEAAAIDQSSGEPVSTPVAGILNANGGLTYPEELEHADPGNGNTIDGYLYPTLTGTPGRCVFLPNGRGGRVVVIDASVIRTNGDTSPVTRFDVYRANADDPWTAIEPAMTDVDLEPGEPVSLQTTLTAFDSLGAYYAALTV